MIVVCCMLVVRVKYCTTDLWIHTGHVDISLPKKVQSSISRHHSNRISLINNLSNGIYWSIPQSLTSFLGCKVCHFQHKNEVPYILSGTNSVTPIGHSAMRSLTIFFSFTIIVIFVQWFIGWKCFVCKIWSAIEPEHSDRSHNCRCRCRRRCVSENWGGGVLGRAVKICTIQKGALQWNGT